MYRVAGLFAVVLVACAGRYGYHRDELYFLAAGRRLDWGYPDQPPLVPSIARSMSALDPDSLVLLRLPAIAAATAVVVCAGLMARELGGGRGAQALAAGCTAAAAVVVAAGHQLGTAVFDLAAWSGVVVLVLRLLRPETDRRWWLLVGVLVGVGLLNKTLLAVPVLVLVVALLVVGPRAVLRTRYLPVAVVAGLLIAAPNLWWQARSGWPQLEMSRAIAGGSSGTSDGRLAFVLTQFGLVGPLLAPVWLLGLWWLWRQARYRAFALVYPALFVLFVVTGGKAYYLGGMYPVLLAAGAVALAERRRLLVAAAAGLTAVGSAAVFLPILPVDALRDSPILAINYDAGETVGWPRHVEQIGAVRARLAPDAEVLTANYGEAAAIEHFGDRYGLPTPHSGHNAYWWWGPPAEDRPLLTVGLPEAQVRRFCPAPEHVGALDNGLGIDNDEQGAPLFLCRSVRAPWAQLWPSMRHLG
ncbi:glycosyltransferase family 39 protein [Nocardia farcinica]|uniref:glycosyltransferase family 39 protein n=1 Tax=Nocardia farcinica TaxID=37329 RepID=UPI00189485EB|nr:glycosyltransferase family 39 protein [Nocardia farcinica]MBF6260838.1 glycosyltransferase family 39 protein [Nocardia farcinica]MBF6279492.1 glycosyltransferase family 39 protein [Nocardia farcinica]MBF6303848.1 glycosyltransferase family 39 protein [Nocardia farcinica]MBF6388890.1 glycosyltransferase family 39 protein [Nocardia farcinica]MBF6489600.1 glycosyltransferase family 39 protein [Nocardia farcinica]